MKPTIRHVLCCALALMLASCGGTQDAAGRPNQLLAGVQTSPAEVTVGSYHDLIQRVYVAYFGRPADPGGIDFWASKYLQYGMPLTAGEVSATYFSTQKVREFVDAFGASQESAELYPGDNVTFVSAIYRNLFNREPDAAGLAYWVSALDRGVMSRPIAALYIMDGARSTDITIVNNKVEVARRFTAGLDTEAKRLGYQGMYAAAYIRSVLSTVGLDTDPATFNIEDPIQTLQNRLSNHRLAAYLGTWTTPCEWHSRDVITITESPGSETTAYIAPKTEYYATENCEGPVIATESLSASIIAVHTGKVNSAIVFQEGAASVPAAVDMISVSLPAHSTYVMGTAVTQTVYGGKAQWCIDYGGGNSTCIDDPGFTPAQGPENGGLYVNGNTIYLLSPVSSIFYADAAYTRR
ncbi:DUF4214 domain-containing protein [Pseudoduganella sp. GCM10020061]|uniref:DUF4214 domain-containing protein n=1 Tax=Pseudoduganella sp. GCM10020061 TaxID=3317345 RepID=UPI00362A2032